MQVYSQTHSLASLQNHLEQIKAEKHAAKLTSDDLQTINGRLSLESAMLKADIATRVQKSKKQHEELMQVRGL